jgi:hypothetical protein
LRPPHISYFILNINQIFKLKSKLLTTLPSLKHNLDILNPLDFDTPPHSIFHTKFQPNTLKCQNAQIDVIHDIKEDGGAVFWVHNNTVDKDVSIFVYGMVLVNVPKPNRQSMISLPHKEHLANKMREVGVSLENGIKLCIGLLP